MPPPELFGGTDPGLGLDVPRWGESQSLTPFGSQQSSQLSRVGGYGLVLPNSSPDRLAGRALEGDDGGQGDQDMQDIDNILQLDDPDFAFGEDGDIIELTPGSCVPVSPETPVAAGRATMHSEAGASSQVRREHAEGQQRGDQVSFGPLSHPFRIQSSYTCHPLVLLAHPTLHHHALSLTVWGLAHLYWMSAFVPRSTISYPLLYARSPFMQPLSHLYILKCVYERSLTSSRLLLVIQWI